MLNLHHVAATRPSPFLCIAAQKDAFAFEELAVLQTIGHRTNNDFTAKARANAGILVLG